MNMRYYGARHPNFRSAPKPANFDALTAAAKAGDGATFALEVAKYREQTARAGINSGTLVGLLDEHGNVS